MREEVIKRIVERKVIAIVRGYKAEECIKLASALEKGGVKLMEVTFPQTGREEQEATASTIKALIDSLGSKMDFGAGTVTSCEMVHMAYEAGASFIISPDTNLEVIKETARLGMVSIPGALTPSEMKSAWDGSADFVKVFPVNYFGPSYIKTVKAPLSQIRLLAVGGVNERNIKEYLENGASGAGVASCLFNRDWIKNGEWERITKAALALNEAIGV